MVSKKKELENSVMLLNSHISYMPFFIVIITNIKIEINIEKRHYIYYIYLSRACCNLATYLMFH